MSDVERALADSVDIHEMQTTDDGMVVAVGTLRGEPERTAENLTLACGRLGYAVHVEEVNGGVRCVMLPKHARAKPSLGMHVLLFVATIASTLFVGASFEGKAAFLSLQWWLGGLPFSLSLMAILLVHEMGHFTLSRRHAVDATLPYFIPFPSIFGTLGAVIRIRSPIPTFNALLDIGAAGPLAGLALALPVTFIGLKLSHVVTIPADASVLVFGNSLLFRGLTLLAVGPTPPGTDIMLSPLAYAGWIGILVTGLNLIPIGQLDGGHIAYALLGKRHKYLAWSFWGLLVAAGFIWSGWWVWAFFTLVTRVTHPAPLNTITKLSPRRRLIAYLALLLLVATVVPVPLKVT